VSDVRERPVWLLIAVLLSAALVAGLLLPEDSRATSRAGVREDVPMPGAERARPARLEATAVAPESSRRREREPGALVEPTPTRMRRSTAVPREGCTASLSALITRAGSGVPAQFEFLAGLDAGTVLRSDAGGVLEARGLYPGLVLARIRAPGSPVLERELFLRPSSTVRLELDLARRAVVRGRVLDEHGDALPGARVSLDGEVTATDGGGRWELECAASGAPLLIVEHAGHAPYREELRALAGECEDSVHDVVLDRGCELELEVRGAGAGEDVRVFVLPRGGQRTTDRGGQRAIPWHVVSPSVVPADLSTTLHDLPPGRVEVVALHALGMARSGVLSLHPGERTRLVLELRSRPRLAGRVLQDGKPVAGAEVVLQSANRARASAGSLSAAQADHRSVPLVDLPAALQITRTDRSGAFVFGDWGDVAGERYLTVIGAEGVPEITQPLGRPGQAWVLDLCAAP
jgi:hypothetical protein